MHRLLFRRHRLGPLVAASHSHTLAGLLLLGMALAGVATLIFGMVVGQLAAWVAGGATLVALATFWVVLPLRERFTDDRA
ncbi:DUF6328 family protein [Mycobacterium hubeiense]|uniref:DUF6328 family protein n=1 Tax=Mycobacterium hubeiense TaxID=1867256 RepID=UPI001E417C69|nr:DUF6328 family protein [Mycobacterium sp. QGD 101]